MIVQEVKSKEELNQYMSAMLSQTSNPPDIDTARKCMQQVDVKRPVHRFEDVK